MAMSDPWCNVCGDDPTVQCESCHSLATEGSLSLFDMRAHHNRVIIDVRDGDNVLAIVNLSPKEAVQLSDRIRSLAVHAEYKPNP